MTDTAYMKRALQLAQSGKGYTHPNPMVGAVLVYKDRIIGEGWHRVYGQAHAEVDCLNSVAEPDRHLIPDSTMYVTLEPCAHTGKTPPCAHRLVKEGIKKVVIANIDPFEQVQGRGIQILKDAGVEVQTGLCEHEGFWVNRRFFCLHTQQRPYIILKWAQSLDGYIAPPDKSRYQLTGLTAQQLVHKWRTEEAAILVGRTTAINDDPQLTPRLWAGNTPLRIVLQQRGAIPSTLKLLNDGGATWVIGAQQDKSEGANRYISIPPNSDTIEYLMQLLHDAKIPSVIIEGGATTLNSFIGKGIWDEARIFTAPHVLGTGIAVAALPNSMHASTLSLGADTLQIFTNRDSHYTHPADWVL